MRERYYPPRLSAAQWAALEDLAGVPHYDFVYWQDLPSQPTASTLKALERRNLVMGSRFYIITAQGREALAAREREEPDRD